MTDPSLANLAAYSAQLLIVVASGALAATLIRLPKARARVAHWRLIVAACLALPLLARTADRVVFATQSFVDAGAVSAVSDAVGVELEPSLSVAAVVTWLLIAGAAVRAAWLGVGILALVRLRRRSVEAALPDDVDVLRKAVAPRTSIRWHARVAQPVAFGWRRPVVLLPQRVADLPIDAQRAVVCHELLHVARRDWLWMLGEEAIRCLLWFHPAIWFALAKLQLSREELVDEEVVRITGVRQPYVRALALFAGEPAAFAAATPFIRRRHLVSRIRHLSEERTMSRLRIACGFVVLLVVIAASGWAAASALPLSIDETTVLPLPTPAKPGAVVRPIAPGLQSVVNLPPKNQDAGAAQAKELAEAAANMKVQATFVELQTASEAHHRAMDAARAFHQGALAGVPTVTQKVAPVYPEAAKGHGVEAMVTVRVTVGTAGEVTNVEVVRTRLTTERDITDPAFWASQPSKLFGQAAEDAVRQWRFEPGRASRRFELPLHFGEEQMVFVPIGRGGPGGVHVESGTPGVVTYSPTGQSNRVRVGGPIRQPRQVSRAAPVYPPAAKDANIQGVVVLELVIGTDGTVAQGKVLRSIPLLDQAALDAVTQWRYEPTLLNGVPVEVIMVATINFTLSQ